MSKEIESPAEIIITDEFDNISTRKVISEDGDGFSLSWTDYCETFFEMLLGFGYQLPSSPGKMSEVLSDLHDKKMKEKYGI